MIETLAIITFLLSDGGTRIERIYPPGGEYHVHFGHVCERNKSLAERQIRTLYSEKKLIRLPRLRK